jgi:hypothetical protein
MKKAWVGSMPVTGLTAGVSTACGHTTLYAEDASSIRDELRRHPDAFVW